MKLNNREKYCYGIGAIGKDMVYALVATFLMIYFTDVLEISPAFVGGLFFVARIWDAVNDPMMGLVVDNTKTKYGKFRPWILIGTVLNAIILIMLFRNPGLSGNSLLVYISVMYILWGMTYTLMDIPYWSFIPAMTNDPTEREKISVIPRVFASLGNVSISAGGFFIMNNIINKGTAKGFEILAIGVAVVFITTSLITVFNVKEKPTTGNNKKFKFTEIFTTMKNNDQLLAMLASITLYTVAINLTSGLGVYYFRYVIGEENLFGTFMMVAGVAQVTGMMLFTKISAKLSRKKIFVISCILPIVGYFAMFIVGQTFNNNIILILISGFILCLGFGFSQVLSTVMLADTVDYGQYKLGYRSESIIFSVQPFMVKAATAVSGLITGIGLEVIGFAPNVEQTAGAINGMKAIMFIAPSILVILALVVYKKFYKLNGKYHEDILKELNKEEAAI